MKKRTGEVQITREMPAGTVDSPRHCWNKHERGDTSKMEGRKIMVAGETKAAMVAQLRMLAEDIEAGHVNINVATGDGLRMMRSLNEGERAFYLDVVS
jgi:hypothetical protein